MWPLKSACLKISMFLGLVFVATACVFAQQGNKPIVISANTKHVSLLHRADYAISAKSSSKTLSDLVRFNWKPLDTSFKSLYEFPDTVLQYWIRFSIQNNYPNDTTLLLKVADKMQQTVLFERTGRQLRLLGKSGFGSRISDLSISGDYWRISLPLKHGQQQDFYLLNSKYIYNIKPQYPAIETFDTAYQEKIDEQAASPSIFRNIKLWVAGFYFAVFIYCCLKFFFQRKDIAYLYYALASIALFLRYSLQVDAIVLETNWFSGLNNDFIFLLSFVPQNFSISFSWPSFWKLKITSCCMRSPISAWCNGF